jgi:hypothetical protein
MKSAAPAGLARRRYIAVMDGRGRRGRSIARGLIVLAVLCGFLTFVVGWIAQPGFMRPMLYSEPWPVTLVPFVALALYILGLGWMVRIYRADPEPDRRSWRYRDF